MRRFTKLWLMTIVNAIMLADNIALIVADRFYLAAFREIDKKLNRKEKKHSVKNPKIKEIEK